MAKPIFYTIVYSDALLLCVPDGTDLQAALNKLGDQINEDLDLADYHVEDGLILTDEEPEDRDRIAWRGHSMGCVGDINDRTYEYAIRQE